MAIAYQQLAYVWRLGKQFQRTGLLQRTGQQMTFAPKANLQLQFCGTTSSLGASIGLKFSRQMVSAWFTKKAQDLKNKFRLVEVLNNSQQGVY
jgi:hypothetical protein